MKQYKAILIDWDDTIGDFGGAAQNAQRDIYEQYRLGEFFPSYEAYWECYHAHNVELWERYGRAQVTKAFLQRDRFLWLICQAIGVPVPAVASQDDKITQGGQTPMCKNPLVALADRIGETFLERTNHYFRVLPGAAELVRYLAAKYPLVVVSNGFIEVQYYKIEHSGLQDCFTGVVLSEEVGIQKPQAGIFDAAVRCLNEQLAARGEAPIEREDILMIGDSYTSDIQGAKNAGIDQLWINANVNVNEDDDKRATYVVTSLAEIYDIV